MGLFNKLKNVLFEEEEIEVPVEEPKKMEKPKEEKKEPIIPKKNVFDDISNDLPVKTDRDMFKAEKTFDFPIFDDEEFDALKAPEKKEEPKKSMGINLIDYERPEPKKEKKEVRAPEIKGRAYVTKNQEMTKHKFQPSPVISPVYGVLDKNYKKEDIIVKKEEKKTIDVDDVRKKAFGTLEEDIEKNLIETPPRHEEPVKRREEKSIDELLEETAFDTIDVKEEPVRKEENESLEVLDKAKKKTEPESINENDTLENDLFDLIDSMYENKEDE